MIGLCGKFPKRLNIVVILVACFSNFMAGCATTDRQPGPPLQGATAAEVVYLTLKGNEWYQLQPVRPSRLVRSITPVRYRAVMKPVMPQKITVAKVRYNQGPAAAKYVIPAFSGDILMERLREGLTAAGYQVVQMERMPWNVKNAVDLSWISTDIERTSGMLTVEGSCTMRVRIDLWQDGAKSDSRDYAVHVSDSAILNQGRLLEEILEKSARELAKQAVPDLIDAISASRN